MKYSLDISNFLKVISRLSHSHVYLYFFALFVEEGLISPGSLRSVGCIFPFPLYFLLLFFPQFSSVTQSCPTLCDPMNRSTPGLPVHHQLPEFTQMHAHQVGDAIQPSHPLSSPSPPAPNPSQHQGLFQCVNSSHEVGKVLEYYLFSAIYKASSNNHFEFLHFFFFGMVLVTTFCIMLRTSVHCSSGTLSTRSNHMNPFVTSTE